MSISTIVTSGFANGTYTTTVEEVVLFGYSTNVLFLQRTSRRGTGEATKRYVQANATKRRMEA